MGEECKGGGIQPLGQERRHGGGKQGRASVTGSPDRGGMQSLIGAIDTSRLLRYFSARPKRACIFLFVRINKLGCRVGSMFFLSPGGYADFRYGAGCPGE